MEDSANSQYKNILDNMYKGIYCIDLKKRITYWNKIAEEITGYKASEVIGKHCWEIDLNGKGMCHTAMCLAEKTIRENRFIEEQEYMKHKDGYRVPALSNVWAFKDNDGKVAGVVHMFTNRAAKISAFEKIEKLKKLAFIDELTGVGNRRYTEIKILTKLQEMEKFQHKEFGILFIDIDRFKDFNDKYGHGVGDKILSLAAQTIVKNIREIDFVGRWGGEEFVAIISDIGETDLVMIAEKLRVLVANSSINFENEPLNVTISIGATMAQGHDSITQLVNRADKLMYASKKIGRNLVSAG